MSENAPSEPEDESADVPPADADSGGSPEETSAETPRRSTPEERAQARWGTPARPLPEGWLSKEAWITFMLPLVVFMLVGMFEPKPPDKDHDEAAVAEGDHQSESFAESLGIKYKHYPIIYSLKILATVASMIYVLPGYRTFFPVRVQGLSVVVGAVGAVVWILLANLRLEPLLLEPLGMGFFFESGERSAFNPLEQMDSVAAAGFLAVRLLGLVVVISVVEEFFLRGMVMRFCIDDDWWLVPIGEVNQMGAIAVTGVAMLMHPQEMLASLIWFSLITWLQMRTRNIWDCILAHAVTNLVMGIWVIASSPFLEKDQWFLM